ncbi:MAG TPA: DNA repair protein RadA [Steroidobacteraceae bacterium]|nr:DNA repair protein RadA [Steroidobacteraceae bacterium]
MAKPHTVFVCSSCGGDSPKWQGQCPDCGAWNTLSQMIQPAKGRAPQRPSAAAQAPKAIALVQGAPAGRTATGIEEFDRVLGGGLIAGSVTLLGGDPGIGKSTLLLQAAAGLSGHSPVLYAAGEESLDQIALRAERLGLKADRVQFIAETSVEAIVEIARSLASRVVVIDSIQTMYTEAVEASPGAVTQLRETTAALVRFAKDSGSAVILIGHVTREGTIAGPRVLEHMVDTVLYFESDNGSRFRIVRAVKNRFGAANEIGVFAMTEQGLKEVRNPSAMFLSRHPEPVAGSIVTVTREGTRPLLVEVQVLVDETPATNPRRVAVGLDGGRLALLLAVIHRHAGVALHNHDVFANVVGGVRVGETAADLPAVLATLSSLRDRPLPSDLVAFGEVGLSGEIRPVPFGEERLREAVKHGFRRAVVAEANAPKRPIEGLDVLAVRRLPDALKRYF